MDHEDLSIGAFSLIVIFEILLTHGPIKSYLKPKQRKGGLQKCFVVQGFVWQRIKGGRIEMGVKLNNPS